MSDRKIITQLQGDAERQYVRSVTVGLRRARLNRQYPDARATADHLQLMGSACHGGLYPHLEIDLRTGLPTYREWVRVRSDKEVLGSDRHGLRPRAEIEKRALADPGSIFGKQLLQHDYRAHLLKKKVTELDKMDVQLMRVDPIARRAEFRIIFDKLDVKGSLNRTTIELSQTDSIWNKADLVLTGEYVEHTDGFRTLIYSMTTVDAEVLFARLSSDENITVTRVLRGTIGPLFLPGSSAPDLLMPLLGEGHPIFSFSLDSAAIDQAEDRDNDPLVTWLGDRFSDEAREVYDVARARHGFRVFRDRKFVTDRSMMKKLDEACQSVGTRNIIYPL